jgi:phosphoribosylformylglycinamidine synthase
MTQSNAKSQMLCLRGSAALSQFRIEKIQKTLSEVCPNIQHLYAEFWHFIWLNQVASLMVLACRWKSLKGITF